MFQICVTYILLISTENKTVKDYFDFEEINNEDSINYAKDMMDIGIEEEETKELSNDSLPELYKYVYIKDKNENMALVVRVEDKDSGWKWIYEDEEKEGNDTSMLEVSECENQ